MVAKVLQKTVMAFHFLEARFQADLQMTMAIVRMVLQSTRAALQTDLQMAIAIIIKVLQNTQMALHQLRSLFWVGRWKRFSPLEVGACVIVLDAIECCPCGPRSAPGIMQLARATGDFMPLPDMQISLGDVYVLAIATHAHADVPGLSAPDVWKESCELSCIDTRYRTRCFRAQFYIGRTRDIPRRGHCKVEGGGYR